MCDIARTFRLGRLLDRPTDPHVNRKLVSLFSIKIASTQATKFCIAKCLPEIDDLPKNVYKITVQECKSPHPVDV